MSCINKTSSEFYLGEDLGSVCLDVCRLKAQDKHGFIYLEDAIINDNDCENCPNKTPVGL